MKSGERFNFAVLNFELIFLPVLFINRCENDPFLANIPYGTKCATWIHQSVRIVRSVRGLSFVMETLHNWDIQL